MAVRPVGRVSDGDGLQTEFYGWLELMYLIDRALARATEERRDGDSER